jgi:aminoglycoside phosphotransferase (APT) family kinase protein
MPVHVQSSPAAADRTVDEQALTAYLRDRLSGMDGLRVASIRLAGQGLSDDTLIVGLEPSAGGCARRLVIRRYRTDGVLREETDPERHFRVLRGLWGSAVPVPRALWYEPDPGPLGAPFFAMDHVDGVVPVPWSVDGRGFLAGAGRGPVADQFVDILVAIHAVDWRARGLDFLGVPAPGTDFAARRVADMERLLERHAVEPEPILEDAVGWLRTHLPDAAATVLVHGDYRTGNLVYDGNRIAAVLDWEFTTLGDPAADLAWVCAPSNRMESGLVCYLLPRDRFLDEYTRRSGREVGEEALHFWEILHQVRNALIWSSAARSYEEGRTRDLRFLRMGYSLPVMRRMVAELLEYP